MNHAHVTEVFAGINTRNGYVPLLKQLIADCDTVFILKGTPGCGKSSLMKSIAARARNGGEQTVTVRCSSDPDSLDAVILPERGIAVADGTPPHSLEPEMPRLRETVIDLADSIDSASLSKYADLLIRLTAKKAASYEAASRLISAAAVVADEEWRRSSADFSDDKALRFASGFAKKHALPGRRFVLPAACLCSRGYVFLPPDADTVYVIADRHGSASRVLAHLFDCSAGKSAGIIPAPNDTGEVCGVFYPENRVLSVSDRYFTYAPASAEVRHVSFRRFFTGDAPRAKTPLSAIRRFLTSSASEMMAEARTAHAAIEQVYSDANDFEAANRAAKSLMTFIFGA